MKVFDVFQNDGGIEHGKIAIHQRRNFPARARGQKRRIDLPGADGSRRLQIKQNALFVKRDFALLRIGRQWMLVQSQFRHGIWPQW